MVNPHTILTLGNFTRESKNFGSQKLELFTEEPSTEDRWGDYIIISTPKFLGEIMKEAVEKLNPNILAPVVLAGGPGDPPRNPSRIYFNTSTTYGAIPVSGSYATSTCAVGYNFSFDYDTGNEYKQISKWSTVGSSGSTNSYMVELSAADMWVKFYDWAATSYGVYDAAFASQNLYSGSIEGYVFGKHLNYKNLSGDPYIKFEVYRETQSHSGSSNYIGKMLYKVNSGTWTEVQDTQEWVLNMSGSYSGVNYLRVEVYGGYFTLPDY